MSEEIIDDYASARERFLAAALGAGANLEAIHHPTVSAPSGGPLAVDVAWLGSHDAHSVLLVTSGVHGFEGPAGSAIQSGWFENVDRGLPSGIAVCFVHALNPWGFAYVSRLTENNVDLNRNFVDWDAERPANPFYHHVRELVRVADVSPATLMRLAGEQRRLTHSLGAAATQVAVDFGQYEDPEGISFGGVGPEFGHRVLKEEIVPLLSQARHLGLIDWHTGVGAFGEIAVLPLDGANSENSKRLHSWWGAELVNNWKRSPLEAQIEADPNIKNLPLLKQGQMKQALQRWLPHTIVTGAVVEFGTEREGALQDLVLVTLYERWLRFVDGGDRLSERHKMFRETARRCFVPEDAGWRLRVSLEGPRLINKALAGLQESMNCE